VPFKVAAPQGAATNPFTMRIIDPNRENYKRTFKDGGNCIFCANEDILECESLGSEYWRVIVNRFPYMDGNVMVVAARHVETTDDLTQEEWIDYGQVLTKVKDVLRKVFGVDSFNVGLNLGPQSGATISHIHWQVIPRKFKNISVMNSLADLYVVQVSPEETKKRIDAAVS
jgi:diadenosine tetraphosphate (Ap4A) HIT family hydrolase